MIIHWIPLLCGLFFGLIPPHLLINSECKYLTLERVLKIFFPSDVKNTRRRRWWKLPLVWIDPVRGYVAALFLRDAFTLVRKAPPFTRVSEMLLTFFLLFLILWAQTRGREKYGETISPTGFLAGMMTALLPVMVTISVVVLGSVAAFAMSTYAAGYIVGAAAMLGVGYFFVRNIPALGFWTALILYPFFINWFRRRKLVIPVRC